MKDLVVHVESRNGGKAENVDSMHACMWGAFLGTQVTLRIQIVFLRVGSGAMNFILSFPQKSMAIHAVVRILYIKKYCFQRDGSCCLAEEARLSQASLSAAHQTLLHFPQGKGEQMTWLKGKQGFTVLLPEFTEEEEVPEIL